MKPQIVLELTEEQAKILQPLMDKVISEKERGRPGILIGQVNPFSDTADKVNFGFFEFEIADKVQEVLCPKEYAKRVRA